MNKTTEIFSSRLEQTRKEKGLTLTKLASKVGVTKQAMSIYLKGKRMPRGDILVSIARTLDISVDYLVGISSVKKRRTNADKIRNMSDEELAEFLTTVTSDAICGSSWDYDGWIKELQSEAE